MGNIPGPAELNNMIKILPYLPTHRDAVISLSLAAWAPVFPALQSEVPDYVYSSFYPNGWEARQMADIETFLDQEADMTWVAVCNNAVVGWIGGRIHTEDSMGEIYILAVAPDFQRQGVAAILIAQLTQYMQDQGMTMMMVETGDDAGHAASRATYERAGFDRWPVARYFRKI